MVLGKTLESPLDCKEIQPIHSEGNQLWDFFGRNDAKAKLQYFGHLMRRVDSLEKTLMLGGIGGRRRRGRPRMRWLDGITDSMGRESERTPGDGDGKGGLACCDSWGRRESDTTERVNCTELKPRGDFPLTKQKIELESEPKLRLKYLLYLFPSEFETLLLH